MISCDRAVQKRDILLKRGRNDDLAKALICENYCYLKVKTRASNDNNALYNINTYFAGLAF